MSSLQNTARVLAGRHGFASFATAGSYIDVMLEVCQSVALDCGAFSAWMSGKPITDWTDCYRWHEKYLRYPTCDWALIPDVIDGDEEDNDKLVGEWPFGTGLGVPVWHYHETLERLARLCADWPRVALGSSGEYAQVGTSQWWTRTDEAMGVICGADAKPITKLHGLRMLNPNIFRRLPLASADSCNAGRNCGAVAERLDLPPDAAAEVIIRRIEQHNSASRWAGLPKANIEPSLFAQTEAA